MKRLVAQAVYVDPPLACFERKEAIERGPGINSWR